MNDPDAALDGLAAALEAWADKYGLAPGFADALARVARNGYPLADRDDVWLAQLLHASLRASVTADSALAQEQLALVAPDLRVRDPGAAAAADAPRVPLRGQPPDALADLLWRRRSIPYYDASPVRLDVLAALLTTALGVRRMLLAYHRRDIPLRMFPSAGGLQPVDTYVVANRVDGLERGLYFHDPVSAELVLCERGDFRQRVVEAVVSTDWLFHAPVIVVLVGNVARVRWKYGTRGYRYVHVDTGVAVQNLCLVAQALGLHGNAVAAFDDDAFNRLLRLDGADRFVNLLFAAGCPAPRGVR